MEETKDIQNQDELVIQELKEILCAHPHWMVRRGNTVILFMLLLGIFISWLIPYPDVINCSGQLTGRENEAVNYWQINVHNSQLSKLREGQYVTLNIQNNKPLVLKGSINGISKSGDRYDSIGIIIKTFKEQQLSSIITDSPVKVKMIINDKRLLETLFAPIKNTLSMNK